MNTVLYSFLVSGLAGLSTLFGCVCLFFKRRDNRILTGALGFVIRWIS